MTLFLSTLSPQRLQRLRSESNKRKFSLLGIKTRRCRIESEEFTIDRVNHTWIYEVRTGLKLFNGLIELPKNAENISVVNTEYDTNLQPKEHRFELKGKDFPYFKLLELMVSFVTRPRLDEVILYQSEEVEVGNHGEWIRIITVENKQNYTLNRIRLERSLDFEPSTFRVEELTVQRPADITQNASVNISKDNLSRTAKSIIAWETSFSRREVKRFRLSCKFLMEEAHIASEIVDLVMQSNVLFNKITKVEEIFFDTMLVANELHTHCRSERDFPHKIGVICQLFEIKLNPLRKLLKKANKNWRSIKLIDEWLKESEFSYDPTITQTWENIVQLRNASPPFHKPDARVIRLCEFFGQNYPPNYPELWKGIMNKFKVSLENFVDVLKQMC